MKRAEAYRRRLLDQGRTLEERAVKQAINLMKQDIKEIMATPKRGETSIKQKVLNELAKGKTDREEIAQAVGLTKQQAKDAMMQLKKQGLVKKVDAVQRQSFRGGSRLSVFVIDDAPKPKEKRVSVWHGANSVFAIGAAMR